MCGLRGIAMPNANINQSQDRHAYLIICHNNFKILQMLLSAIDDDRNDIYIHVDKKTEDVPFEDIWGAVCHSPLTFIERISVNWGVLADMCGVRTSVGGHEKTAFLLSSDIGCRFPAEIAG